MNGHDYNLLRGGTKSARVKVRMNICMIQIVILITGEAILESNYRLFHLFYFTIIQNTKVWRANWNGRATRQGFVPMPWERPQDKACWPTLFDFFKVAVQCQQGHCTATT